MEAGMLHKTYHVTHSTCFTLRCNERPGARYLPNELPGLFSAPPREPKTNPLKTTTCAENRSSDPTPGGNYLNFGNIVVCVSLNRQAFYLLHSVSIVGYNSGSR